MPANDPDGPLAEAAQMKSMATHISRWILLVGTLMFLSSCAQQKQPRPELRLVRQEVGGSLNVVPIDVYLDGGMVGELIGEATLVIPTSAGDHVVAVEYLNPFKDRKCRRRQDTHIRVSHSPVTIALRAKSLNESTYSGEWELVVTLLRNHW